MLDVSIQTALRNDLIDRKTRLEAGLAQAGEAEDLVRLLNEVDGALRRLETPEAPPCDVCGDPVQTELLQQHPGMSYCLCELTEEQQEALSQDLDLAWRIQAGLLPPQDFSHAGWTAHYRYLPHGPISGDFLDVMVDPHQPELLHFLIGDISGKGVAASFLMAQMNALFRSQIDLDVPMQEVLQRANRVFLESSPETHYATLVYGRAQADGQVELAVAGHTPPLVLGDRVWPVEGGGKPVGLFSDSTFPVERLQLAPGESLLLYTDGLSEARDPEGREYGINGLAASAAADLERAPARVAEHRLRSLDAFRKWEPQEDDLTLLVLGRDG